MLTLPVKYDIIKVFQLSGLTVSRYRRSLWYYPLFQIPLMCLGACLIAATLFWLLGLGRPQVAVVIALDLSANTYQPQPFNAPDTVMSQEVAAVKAYIRQNNQVLRNPNEVKILGFGGVVRSLTGSTFETDGNKLETELNQSLQNPDLPQQVATYTTDLNIAIREATNALGQVPQGSCRELLLVTNGEAPVSEAIIDEAVKQRVWINAVVVGATADAPDLGKASARTHGTYLPGVVGNLTALFADRFFIHFNTNFRWIILWLGCAWIALMWVLTMPLDRWIFQGLMKLEMPLAGQLSLGNTLFWSILTPLIIWQLWKILDLPFFGSC